MLLCSAEIAGRKKDVVVDKMGDVMPGIRQAKEHNAILTH